MLQQNNREDAKKDTVTKQLSSGAVTFNKSLTMQDVRRGARPLRQLSGRPRISGLLDLASHLWTSHLISGAGFGTLAASAPGLDWAWTRIPWRSIYPTWCHTTSATTFPLNRVERNEMVQSLVTIVGAASLSLPGTGTSRSWTLPLPLYQDGGPSRSSPRTLSSSPGQTRVRCGGD